MKTGLLTLVLSCGIAAGVPVLAQDAPAEGRRAPSPSLTHSRNGDVYGWQLMTHEERAAVQARLRAARTPEEADRIRRENHAAMQARARERGVSLPPPPTGDCSASSNRVHGGFVECGQGGAP